MNFYENEKILLNTSGALGDLVCFLPTLNSLRKSFSEIYFVVNESAFPLAASFDSTLEKIIVNKTESRFKNAKITRNLLSKEGINYSYDSRSMLKTSIFIPSSIKNRFMISKKESNEYFLARLNHLSANIIDPPTKTQQIVDYTRNILKELDIVDEEIDFTIPYSDEVVETAEKIISEKEIREKKSVVMCIGSTHKGKIWGFDKFLELGLILQNDYGYDISIAGGKNSVDNYDMDCIEMAKNDSRFENFTFLTEDILSISYILQSGCYDLTISNDSFCGHIAGSVGKTFFGETKNYTLSLFGPSNPNIWAPYDLSGEYNLVIQNENPNFIRQDLEFPYIKSFDDSNPTNNISLDQVLDGALFQLKKNLINTQVA